jgi:hypothetical protein
MKKSKTQFYTVSVRTFVIPFFYGSGSSTAKSYGFHGSGSATLQPSLDPKMKNLDLLELEDVGGDLNEEGVQLALVPLSEDPAHFLITQMQSILKTLKPISKVVFAWEFLCFSSFHLH